MYYSIISIVSLIYIALLCYSLYGKVTKKNNLIENRTYASFNVGAAIVNLILSIGALNFLAVITWILNTILCWEIYEEAWEE